MKDTKTQIVYNIIWSLISTSISLGVAFFMTPYITKTLGIEAYGFIALGNQIIAYINIIATAINSYAARYIGFQFHRGEIQKANGFYSSVLAANVALSLLSLIIGGILTLWVNSFINIPENMAGDVQLLFIIVLLNYVVQLIGGTFTSAIFIKNQASVTSRTNSFSSVIYVALLLGTICFFSLQIYSMALAHLIAFIYVLVSNYTQAREIAPELELKVAVCSWQKVKTLISAGVYNSINMLGGTLGSGLDLLVTNLYLNAVIMGQISVCQQIAMVVGTVIALVANAFQPKELEAYARRDIKLLIKYLKFNMQLTGMIGNVFFICFLFLGEAFFKLWMPGEDSRYLFHLAAIIIFGQQIVSVVVPLWYVYTLSVQMVITCVTTVACGVANLVFMLGLLQFTDWSGYVVVGTTTVLNLVSIVQTPYLARKYLMLQKNPFWQEIGKHFGVAAMGGMCYFFLPGEIILSSWLDFISAGMLCAMIIVICCVLVQFDRAGRVLLKEFMLSKLEKFR